MAEEGQDARVKQLPRRDMDAVDRAQSGMIQCEKKVAIAFRAVFGDPENENAQIVLGQLCAIARYGNNEPIQKDFVDRYLGRCDMIIEIKNMLNAGVLFEVDKPTENGEENETED